MTEESEVSKDDEEEDARREEQNRMKRKRENDSNTEIFKTICNKEMGKKWK